MVLLNVDLFFVPKPNNIVFIGNSDGGKFKKSGKIWKCVKNWWCGNNMTFSFMVHRCYIYLPVFQYSKCWFFPMMDRKVIVLYSFGIILKYKKSILLRRNSRGSKLWMSLMTIFNISNIGAPANIYNFSTNKYTSFSHIIWSHYATYSMLPINIHSMHPLWHNNNPFISRSCSGWWLYAGILGKGNIWTIGTVKGQYGSTSEKRKIEYCQYNAS